VGYWSDLEIKFLKENFDKLTNKKLSEGIGRSVPSIKCKLKNLGLSGNRPKSLSRLANSRYTVNLDYFNNLTMESCYWAGFIAADGCVSPERNTLKITLSHFDEGHLKKFRQSIDYSGKIFRSSVKPANINGRPVNSGISSTLSIYGCPEILDSLHRNFNIVKAKTYRMVPPALLTMDLKASFIKGYLDGDGSIILYNSKGKLTYVVNLTGNKNMLFYIRDFCDEVAPSDRNMKKTAVPVKVSKGNYFSYTLACKRAEKLLKHLHRLDTPCLFRKWSKISSLVTGEEGSYEEVE
jgi:hypothetical protein